MRRSAIIGGGVISTHYSRLFEYNRDFELVALVDSNEKCPGRDVFPNVPFYTDYKEMIEVVRPDIVLIATPVNTHYPIAMDVIRAGIPVILEKPMAEEQTQINALFDAAVENTTYCINMLHWSAASEVIGLKKLMAEGAVGEIRSLDVVIKDDYANNESCRIRPDRQGLNGAWYDSGINVLSYLNEIFDLGSLKLVAEDMQVDGSCGQPYYACRRYDLDGVKISITVDWRTASRDKVTIAETSLGHLLIDHNRQSISLDSKVLFHAPVDDRLGEHYANWFAQFRPESNRKQIQMLYTLLYETMSE